MPESNESNESRAWERLKDKYPAKQHGIWQIFGEDSNADLGGGHSTPLLDTVESTYEVALVHAFSLPRFFSWGGGGEVVEFKTPLVTRLDGESIKKRSKLLAEKEKITARLAEIEKELKGHPTKLSVE